MNKKQNSLMRFSRTERLAQLSEQEIVIERKKREIQAKLEAQKKKETEEALRKLEPSKDLKNKPEFSRKPTWSRNEYRKEKDKEKVVEEVKKESLTNAFSNDGSFLDQFKKLSKTGLIPSNVDIQALAKARKKEEDIEKDKQEKDDTELFIQREKLESKNEHRQKISGKESEELPSDTSNPSCRKLLDSNIQLQLPPPGVVQLVPQNQVQIAPVVQPIVQNPILMVPPPSVSIPNQQPMVLNTVPQFISNEIQLKAISSGYPEFPQPVTPVQNPTVQSSADALKHIGQGEGMSPHSAYQLPMTVHLSAIQPPLPMTPKNIPPPSPIQVQNIPPPPMAQQDGDPLPRDRTESISLTLKTNTVKKLDSIPNPLEVDKTLSPSTKEVKFSCTEKSEEDYKQSSGSFSSIPGIKSPHDDDDYKSSRISSAFYVGEDKDEEGLNEELRNLARMVARCGDDFENSLRNRNENDPSLWFLFKKDSKQYLAYRNLVLKYRSHIKPTDEEEELEMFEKRSRMSDLSADHSDGKKFSKKSNEGRFAKQESSDSDSGTKDSSGVDGRSVIKPFETDIYFEKKYNDGYQADNEEDPPYYKMPESAGKEDCLFLPSQNRLAQTEIKNERSESKAAGQNCEQSKSEERQKRKKKSRWGDAVASSSSSGNPVGTNLNLQLSGKLPAPKSNLLSQLTRSDPGLIQYAKQTFGSTNLSEEDWKKAEDHYKINLLYQDLVKKRAEIDKLERAGKFKYEYDSDEDVEGGTWEHKLRQQEMMATQLWAEELTRQAAGKHHIGDFLPPEELERFMEKYNAVKEGREPDLSDYKEFKLKQDNVGYRLLQKMGWNEGQGLGQDGSGITNPVNKAATRHENQGLGVERPDGLTAGDDEYDAYRKRMMLAYRFRPNPLNNPRRPYY